MALFLNVAFISYLSASECLESTSLCLLLDTYRAIPNTELAEDQAQNSHESLVRNSPTSETRNPEASGKISPTSPNRNRPQPARSAPVRTTHGGLGGWVVMECDWLFYPLRPPV